MIAFQPEMQTAAARGNSPQSAAARGSLRRTSVNASQRTLAIFAISKRESPSALTVGGLLLFEGFCFLGDAVVDFLEHGPLGAVCVEFEQRRDGPDAERFRPVAKQLGESLG